MIWLKKKIKEQLGKATNSKADQTNQLTIKIQKRLCKLRRENKFTNKTCFESFPFDPTPPSLYGKIKACKPQNNFQMQELFLQYVHCLMEHQYIL